MAERTKTMNITISQTQKIIAALELLSNEKLTESQQAIVNEAYEAINECAKKQIENNLKSYERIKKKRAENPLYAREKKRKLGRQRICVADFIKEK